MGKRLRAVRGVRTKPGRTSQTAAPCRGARRAGTRARSRACLARAVGRGGGRPRMPARLVTAARVPRPRSRMAGRAASRVRTAATRLTWRTVCVRPIRVSLPRPTPRRRPRRRRDPGPDARRVSATTRSSHGPSVTSPGCTEASAPAAWISPRARSSSFSRRATRWTCVPRLPSSTAIARPRPLDAPVIRTSRKRGAAMGRSWLRRAGDARAEPGPRRAPHSGAPLAAEGAPVRQRLEVDRIQRPESRAWLEPQAMGAGRDREGVDDPALESGGVVPDDLVEGER